MSITIRKGNHKDVPIQIKDGESLLDITGATIELMVKSDITVVDASAVLVKISTDPNELEILDATKGKIVVHFIPADTSSLDATSETVNYVYDIRVITAAAKEYNTEPGDFTVLEVVNRVA